jgi:hypothetical protein
LKPLRRVLRLLLVLFAGSLCAVLWFTSILFALESNRHTAGLVASRLFTVQTVLGVAVSLLALALPDRRRFRWLYVTTALLAVNELALKPVMESARLHGSALGLGFGPWHGVSALLYLAGCACVLVLIWNDDLR